MLTPRYNVQGNRRGEWERLGYTIPLNGSLVGHYIIYARGFRLYDSPQTGRNNDIRCL